MQGFIVLRTPLPIDFTFQGKKAFDRGHLFGLLSISWSHLIGKGSKYSSTFSQDAQLNDGQEYGHKQVIWGSQKSGIEQVNMRLDFLRTYSKKTLVYIPEFPIFRHQNYNFQTRGLENSYMQMGNFQLALETYARHSNPGLHQAGSTAWCLSSMFFLCCWKDWNTLQHIAHKILSTEITKGLREDEGKYAIRVNMVDSVSDNLADDHFIVYKRNQAFNQYLIFTFDVHFSYFQTKIWSPNQTY